jgi:hypothetical protein
MCKVHLPGSQSLPTWLRGCAPDAQTLHLSSTPTSLLSLQRMLLNELKLDVVNDYIIVDTRTDECAAVLSDAAACTLGAWDEVTVQPVAWLISTANDDDSCLRELHQLRSIGVWTGQPELLCAQGKVCHSSHKIAISHCAAAC